MATLLSRKTILTLMLAALTTVGALVGCADVKPVVRDAHDIAKDLCNAFFGEKQGISVEEAGRAFCTTERDLRPWLDEVLSAKQRAGRAAESAVRP